MYLFPILISFVTYCVADISIASTEHYVVVPQHLLLGWSQELDNIDRIQCLLSCSRKIYCLSVNYNRQDKICQLNKQMRKDSIKNFLANSSYSYMEKVNNEDLQEHGIYFVARESNYADAVELCRNHLGSIASYEQLYNTFQPSMENCKEGWLISGEIAFTEIADVCTLNPPERRSNVFPCKTYQSGVYCYRENNPSADTFDYLPKTQRIIRLTDSNLKKLNAIDAEKCCSTGFGGHLATPLDVYNNSLSLGVDLCEEGWLSRLLAGNPCHAHTPPDYWLYPTGNRIYLMEATKEYSSAFCFVPLPNQTLPEPDPFPSHRVINGRAEIIYSLNYYDANSLCISSGGRMATRAEVENAQQLGFDCCVAGWVTSGEVIYPITEPRVNCGGQNSEPGIRSWRYKDMSAYTSFVYCYMP